MNWLLLNDQKKIFTVVFSILINFCFGEPVVIQGAAIREFVGTPLTDLRVINSEGNAIPFQIDEITTGGEYVCPQGKEPNADSGNGVVDLQDEIIFLWEDCSENPFDPQKFPVDKVVRQINITKNKESRQVYVCRDISVPLSTKSYIKYDHAARMLRTPWYYAEFAEDRFHFLRAGVKLYDASEYLDLTNELRVEILIRALWGLLPVHYTEDNMVCYVKRFKCGPLRLIRRGDFHLNLGLGIRGSKAHVNQICYPQMVKVPVYLHAPVRFGAFFKEVSIEMTPVLKYVDKFKFTIPRMNVSTDISSLSSSVDTTILKQPNGEFMALSDGTRGYGWLLQAKISDSFLKGSSFILRKPSVRKGICDCGYKLIFKDLPKGYYDITNWVIFQTASFDIMKSDYQAILNPLSIKTECGTFQNRLTQNQPF